MHLSHLVFSLAQIGPITNLTLFERNLAVLDSIEIFTQAHDVNEVSALVVRLIRLGRHVNDAVILSRGIEYAYVL